MRFGCWKMNDMHFKAIYSNSSDYIEIFHPITGISFGEFAREELIYYGFEFVWCR